MERITLPWKSIGHLLESNAQDHAGKPFLIFEDKVMTYFEADQRVNRIANTLGSLGLNKGDHVSVMLPNCLEFPTTWLALSKLGAVMVPTNITYQAHDLEYILNDSEAALMVLHKDFLPLLEKVRPEIPSLKDVLVVGETPVGYHSFDQLVGNASDKFSIENVEEQDLMNIQYTSGTTGFPKGCMLTHRYWMLLGKLCAEYADLKQDDVDLTAQPFYYMDPQWNVMLCMIKGIPLVIMPKFSVSKFWPTIHENKVTFFYVLGTMPVFLLSRQEDELEKNHRVRAVVCSGIIPNLHETYESRFNCPWREAFGMTETGVDLLVPINDTDCVGSGAMGIPVPSKEALVVDSNGKELPNGELGELVVRGEPMMLGYWKKPEANEEIFRGGWLHTGDLAYKDEKGYFHWVGRLKDMVRRNAENISSSEVEGILMEHTKVKVAAVVPVPDLMHGEEVKAYVILQENETKDTVHPQEIVDFARDKLAAFKVPRYIEYVDDLPRTPSERVEKHKLISAKDDLRLDSYDAQRGIWITHKTLMEEKI